MTVDIGELPARLILAVGEERTLPLPSYAGAGLEWSATLLGTADVAEVRIAIGDLPERSEVTDGSAEPPPMALAQETLVAMGRAVGVAAWRLQLARSFDPNHPAAEHDLIVEVTG